MENFCFVDSEHEEIFSFSWSNFFRLSVPMLKHAYLQHNKKVDIS
jgi:hypothetical protein